MPLLVTQTDRPLRDSNDHIEKEISSQEREFPRYSRIRDSTPWIPDSSTVKGLWYAGFPAHWPDGYAMLMSPYNGETAVHGCHCLGDMVVRMRKVLAIPRTAELVRLLQCLFAGFQSLSAELGFWIPIVCGILDSLSCIPDYKGQQSFPWFRNSDSRMYGERSHLQKETSNKCP